MFYKVLLLVLANSLVQLNKLEEAIVCFNKVIKLDPFYMDAYISKADSQKLVNNRTIIKSNLSNRKCLDHDNKQIILVCYNQYCKSKRLVCKNCLKLHTAHPDDLIDSITPSINCQMKMNNN